MPIVLTLHAYIVYLVLATSIITGIWGLILYFTQKDMPAIPRPWRIMLQITVVVGLLQGLLGLIMVLVGLRPTDTLHFVYGGLAALVVLLAYVTYTTGGKKPRRDVLIYSLALVVMFAAAIRAWMTGN